jgi:hypothetical protein
VYTAAPARRIRRWRQEGEMCSIAEARQSGSFCRGAG